MESEPPAITLVDDENQGLILIGDYRNGLLRYCTSKGAKSYNNSTKKTAYNLLSHVATVSCINNLGINGQFETITPLVSNSKGGDEESQYAYGKWRNTNRIIKSIYIQKALDKRAKEQGRNQYAITMRFSPKLARKIMVKGAAHIKEALTRQLRRSLGYAPDMWLHLEAAVADHLDKNHNYKIDGKGAISCTHGVLHMHGAIAINQKDLGTVKRVVRSLNGSTNSIFQNHELHLKPIHNALGWVNYCHKHQGANRGLLGGVSRYSRTKALGSIAQELYEEDRKVHKTKHLRKKKYLCLNT